MVGALSLTQDEDGYLEIILHTDSHYMVDQSKRKYIAYVHASFTGNVVITSYRRNAKATGDETMDRFTMPCEAFLTLFGIYLFEQDVENMVQWRKGFAQSGHIIGKDYLFKRITDRGI